MPEIEPRKGPRFAGIDACCAEAWAIALRRAGSTEDAKWILYRCKSWRCPRCARKRCQQDFVRFREALRPHHVSRVLFAVLTLDGRGRAGGEAAAYAGLEKRWKNLQRILTRAFGKFAFASTVEAHRNGMPHLNVVIVSHELAAFLRENPGTPSQRARQSPRWWSDWAVQAGFGWAATISLAASKDAVASYVTKFDKGVTSSPTLEGEVTKMSQLPIAAPKRTRRIRQSVGFLPPAKPKDPTITGKLWTNPALGKWLEKHGAGKRPNA